MTSEPSKIFPPEPPSPFPFDYETQGEAVENLNEHLKNFYADPPIGGIPAIRRVPVLEIARNVMAKPKRIQ